MKKKWYKNKWGWFGAVAGILNYIYNPLKIDFMTWHDYTIFGAIPYIVWIVIGFIVGIILQKLWRKFK